MYKLWTQKTATEVAVRLNVYQGKDYLASD
jgi:hypothetical protein